jgi:hypothetical protein
MPLIRIFIGAFNVPPNILQFMKVNGAATSIPLGEFSIIV